MFDLWKYQDRRVKITLKNGHVYVGTPYDYTSALDNEPDGACIFINETEILEREVSSIEVVDT